MKNTTKIKGAGMKPKGWGKFNELARRLVAVPKEIVNTKIAKEQPVEATEFTRENRDFINDANRDFRANRVEGNCLQDYMRALRELSGACELIDRLTAENKALAERIKDLENFVKADIRYALKGGA
jgi:hypothetical protein